MNKYRLELFISFEIVHGFPCLVLETSWFFQTQVSKVQLSFKIYHIKEILQTIFYDQLTVQRMPQYCMQDLQ